MLSPEETAALDATLRQHALALHNAGSAEEGRLGIGSYKRYRDEHPDSGLPTSTTLYRLYGSWPEFQERLIIIAREEHERVLKSPIGQLLRLTETPPTAAEPTPEQVEA
jgi:hypothetical protein